MFDGSMTAYALMTSGVAADQCSRYPAGNESLQIFHYSDLHTRHQGHQPRFFGSAVEHQQPVKPVDTSEQTFTCLAT